MEKLTKKKKAKKGLKKRIGLIAIGGLSLVLTVCLSVGATLAWFAGSTWSSKQLYMGGPVYVEMAGEGTSVGADGKSAGTATWKGGSGNLQMSAFARTQGTAYPELTGTEAEKQALKDGILLPGSRFQVFSQARVYSTSYTNTVADGKTPSASSGANTKNTNKDGKAHVTSNGRITTTTTSVLRARFSINVEFDPSMGFNDFTDSDYSENYPLQSQAYSGDNTFGAEEDGKPTKAASLSWESALGNGKTDSTATVLEYKASLNEAGTEYVYPAKARRDAVVNEDDGHNPGEANVNAYVEFTNEDTEDALKAVKAGTKRSIYKWKFVSKSEYYNANLTAQTVQNSKGETEGNVTIGADGVAQKYAQMGAPFNGSDTTTSGKNGYYGVWVLTETTPGSKKYVKSESDSFYKERCNAYLDSYIEEVQTEYDTIVTRKLGNSIQALEAQLNNSFKNLVNDSSDNIQAGYLNGGKINAGDGNITYETVAGVTADDKKASWLYIDPIIGNDTNTNEISTGMGGWWYLVKSQGKIGDATDENTIKAITDSATYSDADNTWSATANSAVPYSGTDFIDATAAFGAGSKGFTRAKVTATNEERLYAELFEINPLNQLEEVKSSINKANGVKKIVSYAYPFVNGAAELPGDALTNIFANAKITVQISFQALQAFLPFSSTIDGMDYKNPLLGTAKALNIKNAIPIFNEAFDYQESFSVDLIDNL